MFRLVTPAVIAVVLCSAIIQHASSSDSNTTINCQGPTCPQGQYCKMCLGECQLKVGSNYTCEDEDACQDDCLCLKDRVCHSVGLPTVKCYGQQCYETQYCSQSRWKCWKKSTSQNWMCEPGTNSCSGSMKCVKYKGGNYCREMKTTTHATTTATEKANIVTDIPEIIPN